MPKTKPTPKKNPRPADVPPRPTFLAEMIVKRTER